MRKDARSSVHRNQHRASYLRSPPSRPLTEGPPAMRTPGSRATTIGLTVILISASAGMHFRDDGGFSLLCFLGLLVGASLAITGVRMADGPTRPIVPVVFARARARARALAALARRNAAAVGLVMASCAIMVVSGEEDPALCFGMFTLLLLGLILVNIGARDE